MASCGSLGSDKTRMVGFFIAQASQRKFNRGVIMAALSHSLNLMVSSKGSSVRYFLVNLQRGSAKFVYAHITSGFVASRLMGCLPRGGNPETAIPSCAIIVSAQGANSSGKSE